MSSIMTSSRSSDVLRRNTPCFLAMDGGSTRLVGSFAPGLRIAGRAWRTGTRIADRTLKNVDQEKILKCIEHANCVRNKIITGSVLPSIVSLHLHPPMPSTLSYETMCPSLDNNGSQLAQFFENWPTPYELYDRFQELPSKCMIGPGPTSNPKKPGNIVLRDILKYLDSFGDTICKNLELMLSIKVYKEVAFAYLLSFDEQSSLGIVLRMATSEISRSMAARARKGKVYSLENDCRAMEYIAAMWLAKNYTNPFVKEFLRANLLNPEFAGATDMFNHLLAMSCPLHVAMLQVDEGKFYNMTYYHYDLDRTDAGGRTALHLAAADRNFKSAAVKAHLLLLRGASLDIQDKIMEWQPAEFAAEISSLEVAKEIQETGEQMRKVKEAEDKWQQGKNWRRMQKEGRERDRIREYMKRIKKHKRQEAMAATYLPSDSYPVSDSD